MHENHQTEGTLHKSRLQCIVLLK